VNISTNGFLIHARDYKESSSIINIFSSEKGLQSLMFKGKNNNKDRFKFSVFNEYNFTFNDNYSLPYLSKFEIVNEYNFNKNWKVIEFVRGTLRLDGWKDAWKDIFSMLENQTETIENDINKKSEELLIENRYQPEEEDRVVLSVKLKAFENKNRIFNSSYFLDEKGSGENTAMGKLVSITLSAAIDLMLESKIQPGVKTAPHDNENIMYFFKILKENNINIQKNNV